MRWTRPISHSPPSADIEDAYRWYETQQTGLGEEFLAAADAVMQSVPAWSYLGAGTACLPLTLETIEGAAVAERDSFDLAGASFALLPFPIIDPEMLLKLSEAVLRVAIV